MIFFVVMCGPEKTNPKMQDDEILEVADKSQQYLEGWQVS